MSDATVSYWHLRLQLFPRLITKTSKQKHLTGLPKISISQLHNWLPDQEGWWHPLRWRLSPRGRVPSRNRKDGEGKEDTQEGGAVSFLLALMASNFSRLLPPVMFSSGHKFLYHPQEQKLNETQRCFKSQERPNTAQTPHWAPATQGEDLAPGWGAGTSAGLQAPSLPCCNPPWVWVRCFISHRAAQQREGWPTLVHFAPHRSSAAGRQTHEGCSALWVCAADGCSGVELHKPPRGTRKESITRLWPWEKRMDTPGASFCFKHDSFFFSNLWLDFFLKYPFTLV